MKIFQRTLVLLLMYTFLVSGMALADQSTIGEREFRSHCAGCHGLDGKGNGPFVEFLTTKPPSLTTIAKLNQGVFPFRRIYEIIDGTEQIAAHGTKDMPVWGERYAMEIIDQYGEFGTRHPNTVRCRILELVFYVATLQER
jgi:mono/diheme cytochrome c family protein